MSWFFQKVSLLLNFLFVHKMTASRYGTDIVELQVGAHHEGMIAHKQILRERCEAFNTMLEPPWEPLDNVLSFPEDNPEAFGLLLGWIYHGSLEYGFPAA
jgi:hypothetical protein